MDLPRKHISCFKAAIAVAICSALGINLFFSNWNTSYYANFDTSALASKASDERGNIFEGSKFRSIPKNLLLDMSTRDKSTSILAPTRKYQCKWWSVVATHFGPTDATTKQSKRGSNWCLVVVGDRKSPEMYNLPGKVVYLNVAAQEEMANDFSDLLHGLPWNHSGRKNVGYLFAIQQGAEAIWDFDDDNELKVPEKLMVPQDNQIVELHRPYLHERPTYNPYPIFGAPRHSWPRGFPSSHINDEKTHNTQLRKVRVRGSDIGLIQSLADHPYWDFAFKPPSGVHNIMLPDRALTPLNAQACLFKRATFFMLLLPVTVHGRVNDVWRGYFGQRLMWDIGLKVVFSEPLVDQFRIARDFSAEGPLDAETEALVKFLQSWQGVSATLPGRIQELYVELFERGYIEMEDVLLVQHWIKALVKVGYEFPSIKAPDVTPPEPPQQPTKKLSDIELFIPIPPIDGAFKEVSDVLYPSLELFWPKDELNILFVTDKESSDVVSFSHMLVAAFGKISNGTRVELNENIFEFSGHNRQQWTMFWADNFTTSEYVGFVDTDAFLVQMVMPEDLFVGDRPRVIEKLSGRAFPNAMWNEIARNHRNITGKYDIMQGMSYFPVVLKRSHLPLIRESITKAMKSSCFDEAFQKFVRTVGTIKHMSLYSQFGLMVNILYREKHSSYSWHLHRPFDNWDIAREVNPSLDTVPDSDLTPFPRIADHFSYMKPREKNLRQILLAGYCHSLQQPIDHLPSFCDRYDVANNINKWQWQFEKMMFWENTPNLLDVHRNRRSVMQKTAKFEWNKAAVDRILFG